MFSLRSRVSKVFHVDRTIVRCVSRRSRDKSERNGKPLREVERRSRAFVRSCVWRSWFDLVLSREISDDILPFNTIRDKEKRSKDPPAYLESIADKDTRI